MCGIVGYIGKQNSVPVLLDGLKRLEYRGYDSAGIAFQNGKGIEIHKTEGKIKDLQKIMHNLVSDGNVGIGHTRWATHGAPSSLNAHPHTAGEVTVVHNGIIENYRELKAELIAEGCQFSSDTDTEVIPQLISRNLQSGLPLKESIEKTMSQLRGTFAICVMSQAVPHTLFGVRKGSPLVVGRGEDEFFFASDIPAILPYTNKFIFLEDEQICTLTHKNIEIADLHKKETVSLGDNAVTLGDRIVEVDWSPSMAEKDGYDYFMLKEIYEQPRAVRDTIIEWIDDPKKLLSELDVSLKTVLGLKRLQIVACGTSYHAALIGRYMIEKLAHIPVDVEIASEYRHREPFIDKGTLFISITQSGETADTLAAQREAKKRGSRTLTICNVVGSTASREADSVLFTRAGPEIGVASTKAFTTQIAALCLFAIGLGSIRNGLTNGEAKSLKAQLLKVPDLIEKTLRKDKEIADIARTMLYVKDFLYLGRGIEYPIALEGALKLKEISYIHAEGYPAGEMKHGPIALIEEGLPVVALAPTNDYFRKILSNIEEVKARGGRVIALTETPQFLENKADDIITIPATHPLLSPFVTVIPLQLLAYHVALLKGCDVDQPRNLAKSVTVE